MTVVTKLVTQGSDAPSASRGKTRKTAPPGPGATVVALKPARRPPPSAEPAWPISRRWADIDLAGNVMMVLTDRLGYVPETIEIMVIEGIVSLSGWVENGSLKDIVENTVADLEGVRSIDSRIRVLPPSRLAMRAVCR